MKENQLYKAIDVWKKLDENTAVHFRCFEILGENKFCVQSADFYKYPCDKKSHRLAIQNLNEQFIELFIEEFPDVRSQAYDSLEEAIIAHENDFS